MMRAIDWPATAEQPRSGPQSALPPDSLRGADAVPADLDELKCVELNCGPDGGSKEEHSGIPQGLAAVWPRAVRAARQLSVWPSSVCLAIQDWTERFWQVCSCLD